MLRPLLLTSFAVTSLTLAACGDDETQTTSASQGGTGGDAAASTTGSTMSGSTSSTGAGGGGGGGGGSSSIPGGGVILFEEPFEDANFDARGWYDGPTGTLSTAEHTSSGASSFECAFDPGASSCKGGKPARHKFDA
jgi:hypothetical protein